MSYLSQLPRELLIKILLEKNNVKHLNTIGEINRLKDELKTKKKEIKVNIKKEIKQLLLSSEIEENIGYNYVDIPGGLLQITINYISYEQAVTFYKIVLIFNNDDMDNIIGYSVDKEKDVTQLLWVSLCVIVNTDTNIQLSISEF